jgi:hypothetical protein
MLECAASRRREGANGRGGNAGSVDIEWAQADALKLPSKLPLALIHEGLSRAGFSMPSCAVCHARVRRI